MTAEPEFSTAGIELTLDHIGAAVHNLDHAADLYRRLGFHLTGRSIHSGSIEPGGPVTPWGSANHCAMLNEGYIEVIGVTDPEKYSSVKTLLQRYEGVHTVAMRCGNAEAAYLKLATHTSGVRRPAILQREAQFGPNAREMRTARFQNIYFSTDQFPEARFLVIEHVTPEVLWQPSLLRHDNAAEALIGTQLCVADADLGSVAERLSDTFGGAATRIGDLIYRIGLDRGALHVIGRTIVEARHPVPNGALPCVVGFTVFVSSVVKLRDVLQKNRVPFRAVGQHGIVVEPSAAFGTAISFVAESNADEAFFYSSPVTR